MTYLSGKISKIFERFQLIDQMIDFLLSYLRTS